MGKYKINTLCILVISILLASISLPLVFSISSFMTGFKYGYDSASEATPAVVQNAIVDVALVAEPSQFIATTDSLTFDDGHSYPQIMKRTQLLVPGEKVPIWTTWFTVFCSILIIILFVYLVIEFIKFVININKNKIFIQDNIKRLRRFSFCLLLIALFQIASGIVEDISLSSLNLSLAGYQLTAFWMIPWSNMLLGCLSLLMAQIWSIGLKLKEDQALTI